jgi:hypothetical protein
VLVRPAFLENELGSERSFRHPAAIRESAPSFLEN